MKDGAIDHILRAAIWLGRGGEEWNRRKDTGLIKREICWIPPN